MTTLLALQAAFLLTCAVLGVTVVGGVWGFVLSLLAIAGVAIGGIVGRQTLRAFEGPMHHLNETMLNLVHDKFDNRIEIKRDEIGVALRNLQTVQTLIRFSREEVPADEAGTGTILANLSIRTSHRLVAELIDAIRVGPDLSFDAALASPRGLSLVEVD